MSPENLKEIPNMPGEDGSDALEVGAVFASVRVLAKRDLARV